MSLAPFVHCFCKTNRVGEFERSPTHKTNNIIKFRLFLYICVVASILMCTSCSETETYNVAPENGLNVRATPSKNGKIIGKLNYLDDVEVISIDGSWAKIEYGDKEAYVYAEYLNVGSSNLVWLVLILLLAGLGGGAVVHLKKMAHQTCVINLIGDEFSL